MKKLRNLCIVLIAFIGLSSTAFSQNSGTTPAIGTSHSYWVNSTGATHDSGVGNEYLWYITKGDLTTKNTTDFAITTVGYVDNTTAVQNLYKIDINWLAASAGSTYYLHIIETSADGCSNHKAEIIDPFSDFQLAIINVSNSLADAADDLKVCAPNVDLTLNASTGAVEYSYGTTTLYYKIDATNIDKADYVLGYNIDVNAAFTGTVTATYSTDGGTNYSALANYVDGMDVTQDIINTANVSSVIIKVELVNSTTFEGTTAHDVIVKLISGVQGAALATLPADLDKKQDVPARPSTSLIGSN